jgi:hypothetical protein
MVDKGVAATVVGYAARTVDAKKVRGAYPLPLY